MIRTRLLREDDGFSLIELMVALAIGSIVLTSCMFLFTTGLRGTGQVMDRVDAEQRGRVAMDKVTSLLDAQVCLLNSDQSTTPPIVSGDSNTLTFYADLDGASATPDKYTLTYSSTAKTLSLTKVAGTGTMGSTTDPLKFTATPTTTLLLDQVQGYVDPSTGTADPIFKYYAFTSSGSVDETAPITTVSSTNARSIVRVGVKFQGNSVRTKADEARSDVISGQGVLASADPTDQSTC